MLSILTGNPLEGELLEILRNSLDCGLNFWIAITRETANSNSFRRGYSRAGKKGCSCDSHNPERPTDFFIPLKERNRAWQSKNRWRKKNTKQCEDRFNICWPSKETSTVTDSYRLSVPAGSSRTVKTKKSHGYQPGIHGILFS